MDNSIENSITLERKIFFNKLKTHPLFLIRHMRSLFSMVRARSNKVKNIKTHPYWLGDIKTLTRATTHVPQEVFERIPELNYTKPIPSNFQTFIKSMEDTEDFYAANRFHELLGNYPMPAKIANWINEPPLKNDPVWDTYSSCERLANLLFWLATLPKHQRVFTNSHSIVSFIKDSMDWIYSNLEYYGASTSNHILNNARVLIMAGVVLDDKDAVNAGLHIFKHMLAILVQPNGSLRERSSHYQLIVLSWLLDAYNFLPGSKHTFLKDYISRISATASLLCDEDGKLKALIGDISPDATPNQTYSRLAANKAFWPCQTQALTKDDWHIVKDNKNKIILNYPEGSYPKNYPTHGHNDITSFVWLHDNEPILIDSGRTRYSKEAIAVRQKSAMGHNVALVNGIAPVCESLVINGHWCPAPYANAKLKMARPSKNSILMQHNGYARNTGVSIHEREISVHEGGIVVNDSFIGTGEVNLILLWHLDPSFHHAGNSTFTFTNGKYEIKLNVPPRIKKGWCSSEYGTALPNIILITKWSVTLPYTSAICFEVKKCVV